VMIGSVIEGKPCLLDEKPETRNALILEESSPTCFRSALC
jgi:hypothetical protein